MQITRFIKNSICIFLSLAVLFALSACTEASDVFTQNSEGNLVSASGVEYAHLANEGALYYFGDLVFQGGVNGEERISKHMGNSYQTGLFSIKNDDTKNILIRRYPDNEWFSIYRKTSLPTFSFSVDNCSRLELILGSGDTVNDIIHTSCGDGITGTSEISNFLSDVRSQKNPHEAGLYDLITKPDGGLENCYIYAVIYGFFENKPYLAIRMYITSYNDLAYSVSIEDKEYVLSEKWIQVLKNN